MKRLYVRFFSTITLCRNEFNEIKENDMFKEKHSDLSLMRLSVIRRFFSVSGKDPDSLDILSLLCVFTVISDFKPVPLITYKGEITV